MHARGFFLSVDSSSDINNWQNWLKIQMMYIIHIDWCSYKNQEQSFIKESAWLLDEQTDWNNFQDNSSLHQKVSYFFIFTCLPAVIQYWKWMILLSSY